MKTISLLFIIFLFINGVFGDKDERVSVNDGRSVTLHTHLTDIQRYDEIAWWFNGDRIAKINRWFHGNLVYDSDKRFTDRLKMNPQTGYLTITNITSEHSGYYYLVINNNRGFNGEFNTKSFSVNVIGDEVKLTVMTGESVTLHTDITDIQTDDVIVWRFNGDRIARINREINVNPVYESNKRFTDRLKMNPQTGDLTITHITSEHTGYYHLDINGEISPKSFGVSVFSDEGETVSMNDGDSVTLHTHFTDLEGDYDIDWRFNGEPIAIINRPFNRNQVYDDKRFTDRLKMNPQTGDLTITHITSEHTGDYLLFINIRMRNGAGFITKTFSVNVFDDKVKLTVMERESVTLHTNLTDIQSKGVIVWRFNGDRIAKINRAVNGNPLYYPYKRFTGRLKMNPQTGDLTITHITSEHTGDYQLDIINNNIYRGEFTTKRFGVSVFGDKVKLRVMERESVTLHNDLTHIQSKDVIVWRFNGDRIAEINRTVNETPVYESDKRFTDRLKMNPQTLDLTITNITSEHTGYYHLEINGKITEKTFSLSVFGDKDERVSVNDGDSVTLHTHLTDLKRDDVIIWRFNNHRIARINRGGNKNPVYYTDDKGFTDRLKMNPQTGDLTITNITSEHTGDYHLEIINNIKIITKSFGVSVKLRVMEEENVTLHTNLTHIQRDDVILWWFNGTRIARINRTASENPVYDPDERFTDRLKMNPQTGDLTITNITSEHTGYYHLEIISNNKIITKTFSLSVFGDKYERVSVNDGGSVILHTHLTDLKRVDLIMWRFNGSQIAEINRAVNENVFYKPDDNRFTDRLKMNNQTGDLTITNITSEHTGVYHLEINGKITTMNFCLSLSSKVKKVISKDSVSLHIDVTEKQRNDKIHWKIKHNNTTVAEIITENGTITENKTYNKFRDRLMLDNQTGDLIITNMKNEDSGDYEADVTINNTHTIHNTFCFTDSGSSSGLIAGICVSLLILVLAIAFLGGRMIYRRLIMNHHKDSRTGVEIETNEPLRNGDASNDDVSPD